jgi:hypothetical protein
LIKKKLRKGLLRNFPRENIFSAANDNFQKILNLKETNIPKLSSFNMAKLQKEMGLSREELIRFYTTFVAVHML